MNCAQFASLETDQSRELPAESAGKTSFPSFRRLAQFKTKHAPCMNSYKFRMGLGFQLNLTARSFSFLLSFSVARILKSKNRMESGQPFTCGQNPAKRGQIR